MDAAERFQHAQAAFDKATKCSLDASMKVLAAELAIRRGGLQSSDLVVTQLNERLSEAASKLFDARRARNQAQADYQLAQQVAEHGSVRTFQDHLADVRTGSPALFERYQRELDYLNDCADHEAKLKWSYVLMRTRASILSWRPAPDNKPLARAPISDPQTPARVRLWR